MTSSSNSASVTALPVPEQYRRNEKGMMLDQLQQQQDSNIVGGPTVAPGAYAMPPRPSGATTTTSSSSGSNSNGENADNDLIPAATGEATISLLDVEDALEAQIAPQDQDLSNEVQRRIESLTVDAQTVDVSPAKPCSTRPKFVIWVVLGIGLVLVAIGSAIGILLRSMIRNEQHPNKNSNSNEVLPTDTPTALSDLEFARDIFTLLSEEDALLNESTPQYKAVWWIAHEDPSNVIVMVRNKTQSSWLMIERYVMALLYFSTDGPHWFVQNDFLGNTSICDWEGIECNQDGAAVHLLLGKCLPPQ